MQENKQAKYGYKEINKHIPTVLVGLDAASDLKLGLCRYLHCQLINKQNMDTNKEINTFQQSLLVWKQHQILGSVSVGICTVDYLEGNEMKNQIVLLEHTSN